MSARDAKNFASGLMMNTSIALGEVDCAHVISDLSIEQVPVNCAGLDDKC